MAVSKTYRLGCRTQSINRSSVQRQQFNTRFVGIYDRTRLAWSGVDGTLPPLILSSNALGELSQYCCNDHTAACNLVDCVAIIVVITVVAV